MKPNMRGWKFSHPTSTLWRHLLLKRLERLGLPTTTSYPPIIFYFSSTKTPQIPPNTLTYFQPYISSPHFPFSFLFISSSLYLHPTSKLQPISSTKDLNLTSSTPSKGRIQILFLTFLDCGCMWFHFSLFLWCYIGCRWWFMVGLTWVFELGLNLEWEN